MNRFRIGRRLKLRPSHAGRSRLRRVPLTIRTDTEEFRDDAFLDVNEMVTVLRGTRGRSYSACPNIADWEDAFGERGDVIAFTITGSLSGSYSVACAAKKHCEELDSSRRICVVDSLSAGPEIALLIEKARSEMCAGADFDDVCRAIQVYRERTHLLFALESMHNLAQNGRIGKLGGSHGRRFGYPCCWASRLRRDT